MDVGRSFSPQVRQYRSRFDIMEMLTRSIARLDFRGADDTQMKSHVAIKLDLQDSIDGIPLAEGNMTQFHPVIRTTLKTNSIVSFCSCNTYAFC